MSDTHIHETNGHAPGNPFDFDAQDAADPLPREIRGIRWRGKEYVLKRATETDNIKYNNARMRNGKLEQGGSVSILGGGELPTVLVGLCLFEILPRPDGTEQHKQVGEHAVRQQWPPHFIDKLFEQAKRISRIDQPDAKQRAKRVEELEQELARIREEEANDVPNSLAATPDT
jgi:hypothetical protein